MTDFDPLDLDLPGFLESNDVDARLHAIVALVETMYADGTEIRIPCRLVVSGAVITGSLTSRKQWAETNAAKTRDAAAEALMQVLESDAPVWRDDEVAEVGGGQLEHFRVHLVNEGSEPDWRVRIKDISAWALGGA